VSPGGPAGRSVAELGETGGLVFTAGHLEAQSLAQALRAEAVPGVRDVVPAADSVGVFVDTAVARVADVLEFASRLVAPPLAGRGRRVEVPVVFDGPDLGAVAECAGLSPDELVVLLEEEPLRVGWLGFMPGFPYLVQLPAALASIPRLERPRARVPAGAFALAGGCAGIYPQATPGGWNVLGTTAVRLFDAARTDPATFAPGDLLQLRSVAALGGEPTAPPRPAITARGGRRCSVVSGGALSLVTDLGRGGVGHLGVPPAGPADPLRHLIANLAVGNAGTCAAIEVTLSGPTLRFGCDAFVALVGDCSLSIDGRLMPASSVQLVERGQSVSVGSVRGGLRAYLAISGGIDSPAVLGSKSADGASGLWPGPLRPGDELDLGMPGRARGRWVDPPAGPMVLPVTPGPDAGGAGASRLQALLESTFEVAAESNRVGTRLRQAGGGAALGGAGAGGAGGGAGGQAVAGGARPVASRAMVVGAVQVPADGCPLVLGPDHGTVGGYPVLAVVSRDGLERCGQLRPGTLVRFEVADPVGLDTVAKRAAGSLRGWMSTELGTSG
jgi:KipI family sensor histidine kinase inhibitor